MYTYIVPIYVTLGFYVKVSGQFKRQHPFLCYVVDARSCKIVGHAFSVGKPTINLYGRAMLSVRAEQLTHSSDSAHTSHSCELLRIRGPSFVGSLADVFCDVDKPVMISKIRRSRNLTLISETMLASLLMHHIYEAFSDIFMAQAATMSIEVATLNALLNQALSRCNRSLDDFPHWITLR